MFMASWSRSKKNREPGALVNSTLIVWGQNISQNLTNSLEPEPKRSPCFCHLGAGVAQKKIQGALKNCIQLLSPGPMIPFQLLSFEVVGDGRCCNSSCNHSS